MATIVQKRLTGPTTYKVVEPVVGGQVVEGRDPVTVGTELVSGVGVAAAGSKRVVGVAINDGVPANAVVTSATVAGQYTTVGVPQPGYVSVAFGDTEVPVTYSADAHFGDRLVATAGGKVAPAAANADGQTIVGRCTQPGGVTVATKPVGLAVIG